MDGSRHRAATPAANQPPAPPTQANQPKASEKPKASGRQAATPSPSAPENRHRATGTAVASDGKPDSLEFPVAAAADKNKKADAKDKKPSSPLPMIIGAAVIAAAAAGGGAWYFANQGKPEHAEAKLAPATSRIPAPAQYFAMEPPFVVNMNGPVDGPRYLQVEVQLMTRDPVALKNIEANAPAIRARLLMLFSQVQPAEIADRHGKEKLQATSLAEVQKLLQAETGGKGAEALLFTSFVTQ